MGTPSLGDAGAAGSPATHPPLRWRHSGGESDGECDACWAELDVDEDSPRSDPHQAAPDAHQLQGPWEAQFCGICGHVIEAVLR